ncbi:hypothetical protein [Falsarthrobacter nasiphocae]|uniref:SAF domain-containing protein n=1 Tax=Falsarthrobacter nasiphocae TaxID=189863 RepID=A0AAE3YIX7_9MICC|nr:hypothetical protein [Falsarthrobacter nasiphocae]MDR6892576.1 hypothetical protein [Falsarthrobacter nasiphocae]
MRPLRLALFRYRALVKGALGAVGAALTLVTLGALSPGASPPVLVAGADIPAGTLGQDAATSLSGAGPGVNPADGSGPPGLVRDTQALKDRRFAVRVPRGAPIAERDLVPAHGGLKPGEALVMVSVSRDEARTLQRGSSVTVHVDGREAAKPESAHRGDGDGTPARVLWTVEPERGVVRIGGGPQTEALVALALPEKRVGAVAAAARRGGVVVALRGDEGP